MSYEIERYRPPPGETSTPLETLEGIARVAAGMWLRSAAWGLGASVRIARAAANPRDAVALVDEVREGALGYVREVLGVSDLDERIRRMMPGGGAAEAAADENGTVPEIDALRAKGADLLRQSADVRIDVSGHPAYVRILEELAPDEARILRLLTLEGPQPAVDVRALQLLGLGSQLIAEGLNMIGPQAGVRHPERVPAYLNNLNRLGLIWFSKEPLEDSIVYQVLEAQPDVLRAIKGASRTKTVQRSIGLTPFGRDFCEVVLPLGSEPDATAGAQA
jgi:hypothetical protein